MNDKDLLLFLKDMIKGLADINAKLSAFNESIKKLPDAATLKNIESSIMLESQKQHNNLACTEDITRIESRLESFIVEMRARLDHIEHDHLSNLPMIAAQPTIDIVKAVLDSSVKTKELENVRAEAHEDYKLEDKKIDTKFERLKKWLKFWPIFAAILFELLKWGWPHIHELISSLRVS